MHSVLSFSLQIHSPLHLSLTPHILEKLESLTAFCQNFIILRDLKQYRPHRRPITEVPLELKDNPLVKRKRRLIVRDWFFYVVWFVRLRKIVRSIYLEDEHMNKEVERDDRYREIVLLLADKSK